MILLSKKLLLGLCLCVSALTAGAQPGQQSDAGKVPEGATPLNIRDSILGNAAAFTAQPLLLCAGTKDGSNAMTIGWISIGQTWFSPCVTVYVADKRFTRKYLEQCDYFTVMTFKDGKTIQYMGSHSGRDGDKAQALGLHTLYTDNGAAYYAEADKVIECRTMYGAQYRKENIRDPRVAQFYEHFPDGIHWEYLGRITKAWKN